MLECCWLSCRDFFLSLLLSSLCSRLQCGHCRNGRSPRGQHIRIIARSQRQQTERNGRAGLPRAPPPNMPPPPPPPPPPIDMAPENAMQNIPRRNILAIMVGGTALWYTALRAGAPIVAVDKRNGVALLKTKGGNVVAAAQDEAGRLFIFDKAGNIYYDTEDPSIGLYIVDVRGDTFNEYMDAQGDVQRVFVGNLKDIQSVKVTEIGGISVNELRSSIKGFKGGRVIGFPKVADGNGLSWDTVMPPNAPLRRSRNGELLSAPPMLEDMEIELEPTGKGNITAGGMNDMIEIFKSLRSR